MSMQDPIAEMLARIKNAQAVNRPEVVVPWSKMKKAIAEVLKAEGYILDYQLSSDGSHKNLTLFLKYYQGRPVIENIRRISKSGLRVYKGKAQLPKVMGGLGIAIISTSKGVMSDRRARQLGEGGEVLCWVN